MEKAELLARSSLCVELNDAEREVLADLVGIEVLENGQTLISEGESRRTLFILASGRLDVCKTVGPSEETVYQMREGEVAGTRAFVDGSSRKAALRACEPSEVLTLEPNDLESLVETHPRIVYKIMRGMFRITHGNLMRMNLENAEFRNYTFRTGSLY